MAAPRITVSSPLSLNANYDSSPPHPGRSSIFFDGVMQGRSAPGRSEAAARCVFNEIMCSAMSPKVRGGGILKPPPRLDPPERNV